MKTISLAFKNHLRQGVTTICTCLSISRRDGRSYFFTNHDEPLTVEAQTYLPYNSFASTSVTNTVELEVDSMEINGILNSGAVLRDDVNGGLFDYATMEVCVVNYEDPTQGKLRLRRGTIGEIAMNEDGTFNAEVRGLTQVLATRIGDAYSPMCRADLGDERCKIALAPARWQPGQIYQLNDTVTGIVSAAASYVQPAVANGSFEADSPALYTQPTGWTSYGDAGARWRVATSIDNGETTLTAKVGSQYICQGEASLTQVVNSGLYQDFNLITAGIDADQIDTGLCRLFASVCVANPGDDSNARVRAFCYDATGASLGSIWDTQSVRYSADRWNTLTCNNSLIPAGTRKLRIDFYAEKKQVNSIGAAFDDLHVTVNLPDGDFENHPQFGNIRMRCTTAGTSGQTEPAFTDSIGASYTDGTVTWVSEAALEASGTVVTGSADHKSFTWAGAALVDGLSYDMGMLTWETGRNAGRSQEIRTGDNTSVNLFQRTFYEIATGDRFVIRPGCDKRRVTCAIYGNVVNFRGEPDVPGQDHYYATPNTTATEK